MKETISRGNDRGIKPAPFIDPISSGGMNIVALAVALDTDCQMLEVA
jgi:hypothetical protein